jgi:hypothetical protein
VGRPSPSPLSPVLSTVIRQGTSFSALSTADFLLCYAASLLFLVVPALGVVGLQSDYSDSASICDFHRFGCC